MWSDFLKKAIANVELLSHDSSAESTNGLLTAINAYSSKKNKRNTLKSTKESHTTVVAGSQNSNHLSDAQNCNCEANHEISKTQDTIITDKNVQKVRKAWYPAYESDEMTENRLSKVFPATMPNDIDSSTLDANDSKKTLQYKEEKEASSSDFNPSSFDLLSSKSRSTLLRQIIDEKDKKIQILLKEGEKMSKQELKHLSIIKGLRSKIKTDEKNITEMEKIVKKSEVEVAQLKEKLKHASENNTLLLGRLKEMIKLESAYHSIKKERDQFEIEKNNALKSLLDTKASVEEALNQHYMKMLESEKSKSSSLLDALNSAKVDLELLEKKNKSEIDSVYSLLKDEKNKFLAKEKNYLDEISTLEKKIETLRYEIEELSCNMDANAYVKLLQQNETLQTRYSIASQLWKEKEDMLLIKNTDLQEKNENYIKEIDKETSKSKYLMEKIEIINKEMDKLKMDFLNNENILKNVQLLNHNLKTKISELEETIIKINASHNEELEELKESLKHKYTNISEEKHKLDDNDKDTLQVLSHISQLNDLVKIPLTENNAYSLSKKYDSPKYNESTVDILSNSTDNICHEKSCDFPTPNISYHLSTNLKNDDEINHNNGNINEAHFIDNQDQLISRVESLIPVNFSEHSTSKVGSNINIIQRLNLSIQKLKGQLLMARNEINRIIEQRDNARNECFYLMIKIEKNKELEHKINVLEEELKKINERYEQCLILLGEKSEKEEELRQDITDMKELYSRQIEELITKLHHS